jgi:Fe2+ transport system protein B
VQAILVDKTMKKQKKDAQVERLEKRVVVVSPMSDMIQSYFERSIKERAARKESAKRNGTEGKLFLEEFFMIVLGIPLLLFLMWFIFKCLW